MLPWVRIRSLVKAPIFGALLLLAWGQTLGGAQACPCLDGADNFCQYGPSYPGCTMTYPGGYCDPNGDGDFSDADWARGYYEYLDACGPGDGDPLPDVYIEDLWWAPGSPTPGQEVQFHVRVHNGGDASTGADVGVGYFVDGQYVGWGIRGPMAAGETSSDFGMVQRWTATSGSHRIMALVDDINRFQESNEENNSREETLTVGDSIDSITGGLPKGPFGSGGQTDGVTEPGSWRWSEWFYGHRGIDRIEWRYDACGGWHNYAMGWHGNDLIEYLMKSGGEYSRLILRGIADRPGPVELAIYIDGQYKASAVWDNNDDCNEDVALAISGIPYGPHAIAVQFVNDYYNPPEDRNFYLDGLLVERSSGGPGLDVLPYIIPENENFRVYSRLRYPDGGTADEVFAYQDGGWSDGLRRWFFVKNPSGENWEEFGYDGNYIYRYRDTSWANTCQDGAAAFYQVTDQDRSAFARWLPRRMEVGKTWTSPVSHYVDAGYKRTNDCRTDTCSSVYEGWVQNRMKLVAHHGSYTTIWGYTVNDVIELTDPYNPNGDHFFYARGYGLVGFEGPAGGDQGRFTSGAYDIQPNAGGPPNWVSLCGR